MIKPTVGRVVWFYPGPAPVDAPNSDIQTIPAGEGEEMQPCAALVTFVYGDRMVNLAAFDHYGRARNFTSVPLLQEGDEKPDGGSYYAAWMPYQVGQAAKHASGNGVSGEATSGATEAAKQPEAGRREAHRDHHNGGSR